MFPSDCILYFIHGLFLVMVMQVFSMVVILMLNPLFNEIAFLILFCSSAWSWFCRWFLSSSKRLKNSSESVSYSCSFWSQSAITLEYCFRVFCYFGWILFELSVTDLKIGVINGSIIKVLNFDKVDLPLRCFQSPYIDHDA